MARGNCNACLEKAISRVSTAASISRQPLPPRAQWATLDPDDYDYAHVRVGAATCRAGSADLPFVRALPRRRRRRPGYQVLAAMALEGGGTILVDRGFAPLAWKDDPDCGRRRPPAGRMAGLMRPPRSGTCSRQPTSRTRALVYPRPRRDAAKLGLEDAAPFVIDADAQPGADGLAHAGATELRIPNNHLSLCADLVRAGGDAGGVFGVWAWNIPRASRSAS